MTSSPELLAIGLTLAVFAGFILIYRLGYLSGESSKIAGILEELLQDQDAEETSVDKQRDAQK